MDHKGARAGSGRGFSAGKALLCCHFSFFFFSLFGPVKFVDRHTQTQRHVSWIATIQKIFVRLVRLLLRQFEPDSRTEKPDYRLLPQGKVCLMIIVYLVFMVCVA